MLCLDTVWCRTKPTVEQPSALLYNSIEKQVFFYMLYKNIQG